MVSSRLAWYVWLAAAPLWAGTIDVSSQSSVVLHDGDALSFAISAWSYQAHAAEFGAPADPPYVSFSLIMAPIVGTWDLSFALESNDGRTSAAVTDTRLSPGYFEGSLYQGPVSAAYGSLALSPELSSQIFAGPAVLLVLRATGGDVTLGLSPYSLLQSLQVSLSGDGSSVGGTVAAVSLERADSLDGAAGPQPFLVTDGLDGPDPLDVPEPQSGALMAFGGALLCLLAHFLKRSRRRGI
jgi:hypothetical protein